MKISLRFMFTLSFLMVSSSLWATFSRPSPTTPGQYSNWGGEIDKLVIVAPFKLADYNRIVVEPFDTSSTPLPNEQDSTYISVKSALDHTTPVIAAMLSSVLPGTPAQVQEPGASPDYSGNKAGALVIRGKVLTMEPGSLVPVYSPNGPGRARTVIACEVVDGITGKTLLRFQQERRVGPSGGSEETFGRHTQVNVSLRPGPTGSSGDLYEKALAFNLRFIGRDLADVLKSF
jgi:hypothetical protein